MARRKIVQIAFEVSGDNEDGISSQLIALCDDGSVWYLVVGDDRTWQWKQWELPPIPDAEQQAEPAGEEKA